MIHFKGLPVLIAINPIDFRAGHNRLRATAELLFKHDLKKGLFLYRNRRRTDIKLICYNGTGWFMGHQKLSKGRLSWWPRTEVEAHDVLAQHVTRLLMGFDPRGSWHPEWECLDDTQGAPTDTGSNRRSQTPPGIG